MKCKDIINLLSPYLEGELERKEREKLKAHLKECPKCREELSLLEKTIQSVKDLEEVAPPANLLVKINEALDKRLLRSRLSLVWEKMTRPIDIPVPAKSLALAASILLILYLAVGPGQVYRTSKIPSEITPPAKISLEVTKLELAIPQPASNIFRPVCYAGNPAQMARSRAAIRTPAASYSINPEAMKALNYPCLNYNNPATMAKARKALGFSSPGYSVSPRNFKQ